MPAAEIAPAPLIESRIYLIRGFKVLLDRDLAHLYQVKPIALRQQVRRNPKRFPSDFMFELDEEEVEALLSQNVIPSRRISVVRGRWPLPSRALPCFPRFLPATARWK